MLWIRDGRDYGVIKFRAVDNFSIPGELVISASQTPLLSTLYSDVKVTIVVDMHIKYYLGWIFFYEFQ